MSTYHRTSRTCDAHCSHNSASSRVSAPATHLVQNPPNGQDDESRSRGANPTLPGTPQKRQACRGRGESTTDGEHVFFHIDDTRYSPVLSPQHPPEYPLPRHTSYRIIRTTDTTNRFPAARTWTSTQCTTPSLKAATTSPSRLRRRGTFDLRRRHKLHEVEAGQRVDCNI